MEDGGGKKRQREGQRLKEEKGGAEVSADGRDAHLR